MKRLFKIAWFFPGGVIITFIGAYYKWHFFVGLGYGFVVIGLILWARYLNKRMHEHRDT